MRIVAGEFGSRRIDAPKGNETRPTLDKVREAVFSSLGGTFSGGRVLDLYAGSGANGIEALSRGFAEAVFVDLSRDAISVIRKNIQSLHIEERCTVFPISDMKALRKLSEEGKKFDLVYLDPPYAKQKNNTVMAFLNDHQMMNPRGRVVIESLKEDEFHENYSNLKYVKDTIYGITRITYYQAEV